MHRNIHSNFIVIAKNTGAAQGPTAGSRRSHGRRAPSSEAEHAAHAATKHRAEQRSQALSSPVVRHHLHGLLEQADLTPAEEFRACLRMGSYQGPSVEGQETIFWEDSRVFCIDRDTCEGPSADLWASPRISCPLPHRPSLPSTLALSGLLSLSCGLVPLSR